MGPDEFHDGYPGAPGLGLRNNTYTNVMTAWVLRRAVETVGLLEGRYCEPLRNRLNLRPGEVPRWQHISRRLRVPFHAGRRPQPVRRIREPARVRLGRLPGPVRRSRPAGPDPRC